MRIAVVVKPVADERMRKLRAAVERVRAAGHQVRVRTTRAGGDARRLARGVARAGAELVVAAGGDGTVNEVVSGIAVSGRWPRLGIVPLGTANDFARGSGIPLDPGAALEAALEGRASVIDIACVNRRHFINVSTGGFGASATAEASRGLKRRLGALAYVVSGARRLIAMMPERARFVADGEIVHDGAFVFFAVANSGRTGGGTRIAPRADAGDGRLDITVVTTTSRLDFLSLLPDLRAGTHLESPDVLYLRARRFEVRSEAALSVNVDGEPMSARRLAYSLHPHALELMVPVHAHAATP